MTLQLFVYVFFASFGSVCVILFTTTKNNNIHYLCFLMQFYMLGWKGYFLYPFCARGHGVFIDYP